MHRKARRCNQHPRCQSSQSSYFEKIASPQDSKNASPPGISNIQVYLKGMQQVACSLWKVWTQEKCLLVALDCCLHVPTVPFPSTTQDREIFRNQSKMAYQWKPNSASFNVNCRHQTVLHAHWHKLRTHITPLNHCSFRGSMHSAQPVLVCRRKIGVRLRHRRPYSHSTDIILDSFTDPTNLF
jgi:hypothetical protein